MEVRLQGTGHKAQRTGERANDDRDVGYHLKPS